MLYDPTCWLHVENYVVSKRYQKYSQHAWPNIRRTLGGWSQMSMVTIQFEVTMAFAHATCWLRVAKEKKTHKSNMGTREMLKWCWIKFVNAWTDCCFKQTLQAKVKSLERQKKTYLEKLEQNPIEQQGKLEKELNETSKQLRETTQKLAVSN